MEGKEEVEQPSGAEPVHREGEKEGSNVGEVVEVQQQQQEGGEGSLEGEKGTRLRGKSKAGLILEPLLDPIAAAVNRKL